jgi:uncharacterized protein (TIGR03435 family)
MNAVPQPWVERLGWTLVHFLWQGLSIAILYAAGRRAMARTAGPNARYLLACTALAVMMAAPLITWVLAAPLHIPAYSGSSIGSVPTQASTAIAAFPVSGGAPGVQPRFLFWVVMVWLAGAVVLWVRLAGGWIAAARMRSIQVRPAPAEWQQILRRLADRIGLSHPVQLLVSALVQVPSVVGWLRPVVLVPVGALSGLPPEHVEALLLHELAHIRRHDYLINLLQSIAEALLFYHPAVWWVSGHIRDERELCCDDVAVSVSGDVLTYARALAQLESYRPAHPRAALAVDGGALAARIARLLGQPRPVVGAGVGPGVLATAILLVAAAFALFAQSSPHPAFQSVSIQRSAIDWNDRFTHPMGMGANASLMLLIRFAYADHSRTHSLPLPTSQVVGGPPWLNSEGYDIDAKPPAGAGPKQFWQMWQTLLADRFQLRLHRETRELPVYVLTAAKKGLQLPAPRQVQCVSFPPGVKPRQIPGQVDCGYIAGPYLGNNTGLRHIRGSKVRMADLTAELALILDRPVLDQTGFSNDFDLDIGYRDLPAALEEQLGLKLVPSSAPVEVLVIDHAERPATN